MGGDAAPLVDGILHRFETNPANSVRGREVGAVADRQDRWVDSDQAFVDDDTVVDGEPGIASELGVGNDADADQDEVGREALAVGRLDAGHPPVRAKDARHPGPERDPRTPVDMRLGEEPGDRRRHHAAHRVVRDLDDVDRGTARDRNGGKFEADEARADDHHLTRLV